MKGFTPSVLAVLARVVHGLIGLDFKVKEQAAFALERNHSATSASEAMSLFKRSA
jgi:hypothetical protein